MRKSTVLVLAATLVSGLWLGDAFAGPLFNTLGPGPGGVGDAALPLARPAPTAFATTMGFANPSDTIIELQVGRDDISPYCGFTGTWGGGPPGAPWTAATTSFYFRPLWDSSLTPNLAGPSTADYEAHWTAVNAVAQHLFQARPNINTFPPVWGGAYYILFVVDSTVGTANRPGAGSAPHANEFYKFEISY